MSFVPVNRSTSYLVDLLGVASYTFLGLVGKIRVAIGRTFVFARISSPRDCEHASKHCQLLNRTPYTFDNISLPDVDTAS